VNRYRFIEAEKHHAVSRLCRVPEVSRAAYYRWKSQPTSPRAAANLVLLEKIRKAHTDSGLTHGSPRIQAELEDQGVMASRGRIARLMASSRMVGRRGRRRVRTTIPAKKPAPFPDLVGRRFSAEHPNQAGVRQSMGRVADYYDNSLAESFFATLKGELLYTRSWPTRRETRGALVHWIEAVYNRRRRRSSIGMLAPVVYEERHQVQCNAA
jgi:transposase InsO family protein